MAKSPHDKLFKEAFADPENAIAELRSLLPASILEHIDPSSLAPVPGSFVDASLADALSDLLFSARLAGQDALLYFLFEHKSAPYRWTGFQLLRYMVRIWEQRLAAAPQAKTLPPVIPIVVYHDRTGFRASTSFVDLVHPVVRQVPELLRLTPSFDFLVDDISHATDAELRARSLTAFGLLAVLALRDARTPERLVAGLQRWTDVLLAVLKAPDGVRALSMVFQYLSRVGALDLATLTHALRDAPQAEEVMMTIAEQMHREGRQEGMLQGQRSFLIEQLIEKFGPLDQHHRARLEAADLPALSRYGKRLLTAATVEEVFAV